MSSSSSPTRITILVDNNIAPNSGLKPEHGFSALIETDSYRILFDTGQGPALEQNSKALGVDLTGLSAIVLSHGHFDHTGGLSYALGFNPGVEIIAHPEALGPHFSLRGGETLPHDVGMPERETFIERHNVRFRAVTSFERIKDNVWFTGEVPRYFSSSLNTSLVVPTNEGFTPDPFPDDASVLLTTDSGPVLLLGCAHAGLRNIMRYVTERLDLTELAVIIGGTHLGLSAPEETPEAIRALQEYNVSRVAPCHCTGAGPIALLKERLGEKVQDTYAGAIFDL